MIARTGGPSDRRGEIPLSPAAERELEAAIGEFRGMVRAKAVEHARRSYLDEVSIADVRAGLAAWRAQGSARAWWSLLGAIGSLLLGAGITRVVTWVGSRTLDPVAAVVTLGLVVGGIVLLGLSAVIARR